jgi:hypothetical protein
MDVDLDLRLVNAEFDESGIEIDERENVSGVLALRGDVDDDWRGAFAGSGPPDAPWMLEDSSALRFGPIPIEEFPGRIGALRQQIKAANESVQARRRDQAIAERIAEERHARARQLALETLGSVFGRRLSDRET